MLQRPALERPKRLEKLHADKTAELRAQGMDQLDAELESWRWMGREGYWPREAYYVARAIDPKKPPTEGVPSFDFSEPELATGVVDDMKRAIEHPGEEVDHTHDYQVHHKDCDTSMKL